MKFYDGDKIADIALYDGNGTAFTADFYEVGGLPYNEEQEAHEVESVDYLIDQARDYINGWNDYKYDQADEGTEVYIDGKKLERDETWRPVTKDGHAIEKGDWITSKGGGIEEVYKVDEEGAWTQEVIFEDDESDNYHLEPQTYITRQELKHYEYN